MNVLLKKIFPIITVFILFIFIGCNDDGDDDDDDSGSVAFYSSAVDTSPVIVATQSAVNAPQFRAFAFGTPTYEIFNTLREYINDRDEGVIGLSNIYKLLYQAGEFYEGFAANPTALGTPTAISSPFDFGTSPVTYTHALNDDSTDDHGYAIMQDGDTVYALLTWTVTTPGTGKEYGVMEGNYNDVTGDVHINLVCFCDYDTPPDYCLRTELTGNANTHTFTLRIVKYNPPGGYAVTMVGTGVSQSSDSTDYFLFKISDDSYTNRYYKFYASADEDDFIVFQENGYADASSVPGGDPDGYDSILSGITPFALDGSDNARDVTDFTGSTVLLTF